MKARVVLITIDSVEAATKLAEIMVTARVAACVNLLPGATSVYRWQGKICKESEVLMVVKTTKRRIPALQKVVGKEHPYENPEFVVLKPTLLSKSYAAWLDESTELRVASGIKRKKR